MSYRCGDKKQRTPLFGREPLRPQLEKSYHNMSHAELAESKKQRDAAHTANAQTKRRESEREAFAAQRERKLRMRRQGRVISISERGVREVPKPHSTPATSSTV